MTICNAKSLNGRPCERDKDHDGPHMNFSGAMTEAWGFTLGEDNDEG